jgi:hypothetical protein
MNYELKVNITNNKSAKFHYQVVDENGTIISERKSNREYVACTIHGSFYFGRIDLIGKGDHGRYMRDSIEKTKMSIEQFAKFSKYYTCTHEKFISDAKESLVKYQQIAYKK